MRGTAILSILLAFAGWASYLPLSKYPQYRATMWPMFLILAVALILAVMAFSKATAPKTLTRILAGAGGVIVLLMVPVYFLMLRVPEQGGRPQVGQKMPGVNVVNEYGDKLYTASFVTHGPVLLVFFRGFWCVNCMDQLPNLGMAQKALKDQGGELIAISIDSVDTLKAGRKNYPALPVLLASDQSCEAIKALHLTHETMGKTLPAPSTILIDKEGIVRYVHYPSIVSDRPNPLTVVYEIQKLAPADEKSEDKK